MFLDLPWCTENASGSSSARVTVQALCFRSHRYTFHLFVLSGHSTRRRPFVVIFTSPWLRTASSYTPSQWTHVIHSPGQSHCGWFKHANHCHVFEESAQCEGSFTCELQKYYEWGWRCQSRQLLGQARQGTYHQCSFHMLILLSRIKGLRLLLAKAAFWLGCWSSSLVGNGCIDYPHLTTKLWYYLFQGFRYEKTHDNILL